MSPEAKQVIHKTGNKINLWTIYTQKNEIYLISWLKEGYITGRNGTI